MLGPKASRLPIRRMKRARRLSGGGRRCPDCAALTLDANDDWLAFLEADALLDGRVTNRSIRAGVLADDEGDDAEAELASMLGLRNGWPLLLAETGNLASPVVPIA